MMLFTLFISIVFCNSFIHSISFFYPQNLTVPTCTDNHSWTKWFNTAKPNNDKDFDQELLSIIQTNYNPDICTIPQGIQAQAVTTLPNTVNYAVSWKTIQGKIMAFVSRTPGVDFQVRFCCANSEFITTTPRPMDSHTCGRTQIKPSFKMTRIFGGLRAIPHSWPWVNIYQTKEKNIHVSFFYSFKSSKFCMKNQLYVKPIRYVLILVVVL